MFIIYLLTIITVKAYNLGIADFEQFKALLILGETVFAAYVGQIVHAMFSAGSTEATEPSGVRRYRDASRAECARTSTTVSRRCRPWLIPKMTSPRALLTPRLVYCNSKESQLRSSALVHRCLAVYAAPATLFRVAWRAFHDQDHIIV